MPPGVLASPGAPGSVFILVYRHLSPLTNAPPLRSADPGRPLALSCLFAVLGRGASLPSYQSKESLGAPRKAEGHGSETLETGSYFCPLKDLRVWYRC